MEGFAADENAVPYLVNPTQCTGAPLEADLVGLESWEGETALSQHASVGPFTGCESLRFAPTISVAPEQTQATTPTGYEVDLRVPQTEGAEGLATPDLKDAVVKMPGGCRALAVGGDRSRILQRSRRSGSAYRTAGGMPNGRPSWGRSRSITPALTGELKGRCIWAARRRASSPAPPFTVYLTFEGHGVRVEDPRHGHARPCDRPGHDDLRRKPRAAVQRTETPPERRLARDARQPERLRLLQRRSRFHAVERAVHA